MVRLSAVPLLPLPLLVAALLRRASAGFEVPLQRHGAQSEPTLLTVAAAVGTPPQQLDLLLTLGGGTEGVQLILPGVRAPFEPLASNSFRWCAASRPCSALIANDDQCAVVVDRPDIITYDGDTPWGRAHEERAQAIDTVNIVKSLEAVSLALVLKSSIAVPQDFGGVWSLGGLRCPGSKGLLKRLAAGGALVLHLEQRPALEFLELSAALLQRHWAMSESLQAGNDDLTTSDICAWKFRFSVYAPSLCGVTGLANTFSSHWIARPELVTSKALLLPQPLFEAVARWLRVDCGDDGEEGESGICFVAAGLRPLPTLTFGLSALRSEGLGIDLDRLVRPWNNTHFELSVGSRPANAASQLENEIILGVEALPPQVLIDLENNKLGFPPTSPQANGTEAACAKAAACRGQQLYREDTNSCEDPPCNVKFYRALDERTRTCVTAPWLKPLMLCAIVLCVGADLAARVTRRVVITRARGLHSE